MCACCFPLFQQSVLLLCLAADIVLNEEPWLNATTACTFPEPFYPPTEASKPLHSLPIFPLRDPSVEKQSSSPISAKQREQFVGQYGNFLYGNLTVAIDDVTEELIMTSDLLSCVVRNVSGRVLCFGENLHSQSGLLSTFCLGGGGG